MRTRTPYLRVARFGQHLLAVATVGAVLTGCGAAAPDVLSESDISPLRSTTAAPASTTSVTPTPTPEATDTPDAQTSVQQPFVASPRTKATPRRTTAKTLPPTVPRQAAAVVQAPATTTSTTPSSTIAPIERLYDNCSDVRAAGADPIYPGDPGWQPKFDRDNDGIGCEPTNSTTMPPTTTTTTTTKNPVKPPTETGYANCSEVRAAGADPIYPGDPGWDPKFDRDDDGIGCE